MFSFEKNIKMFFSNETFSLPSKQEMQIFCSTATASLYSSGHQPPAPTTTQPGPSACRKIAGMLKVIICCVKELMSVLFLQFLPSANFSFPTTAPKIAFSNIRAYGFWPQQGLCIATSVTKLKKAGDPGCGVEMK